MTRTDKTTCEFPFNSDSTMTAIMDLKKNFRFIDKKTEAQGI